MRRSTAWPWGSKRPSPWAGLSGRDRTSREGQPARKDSRPATRRSTGLPPTPFPLHPAGSPSGTTRPGGIISHVHYRMFRPARSFTPVRIVSIVQAARVEPPLHHRPAGLTRRHVATRFQRQQDAGRPVPARARAFTGRRAPPAPPRMPRAAATPLAWCSAVRPGVTVRSCCRRSGWSGCRPVLLRAVRRQLGRGRRRLRVLWQLLVRLPGTSFEGLQSRLVPLRVMVEPMESRVFWSVTPATGDIPANFTTAGHEMTPDVAVAADGSFIAVWEADRSRDDGTSPDGGEDPRLIIDDAGSVGFAWQDDVVSGLAGTVSTSPPSASGNPPSGRSPSPSPSIRRRARRPKARPP